MSANTVTLQQINDNISVAVRDGKYLTLKTHRMTDLVEKHIQYAVESILDKSKRPQLVTTAYTILKELVINGCKANQKRVFFEERGLSINNDQDYDRGNEEYKRLFSEQMSYDYGVKARQKGYSCMIDFHFDPDGLTVEVVNNTGIARQEEATMREKFKKAMGYNDIAEFYMDQAMSGESEGAGLGIALIIILLKGENIDPNMFRIVTEKDRTVARLEIPFTEKFVSKRTLEQTA